MAQRELESEEFDNIFEHLSEADVLECLKEKNETKETPLHKAAKLDHAHFIESVLELDSSGTMMEYLLAEKDENSNTALHLAAQTRSEASPLLQFVRVSAREPLKYFTMKNNFGWTPFSGAVTSGDIEMVKEMLRGLNKYEKAMMVNQPDFSNTSPIHLAAKYGHVEVFNTLLDSHAEMTRRGPDQKTALDIAIDCGQRGIIQTIIKGPFWKEAFQMPSTSEKGELDTPLRKLIRQLPDLAEEFLDNCCKTEVLKEDDTSNSRLKQGDEIIRMNYEFIEDTHKYRVSKVKGRKEEATFHHVLEPHDPNQTYQDKKYVVETNNHPMMVMAEERKVDLLQHPLCLAIILRKWVMYGRKFCWFQLGYYLVFLLTLNLYIITSPSPIQEPQLFSCTQFFAERNTSNTTTATSKWNNGYRFSVLTLNVFRIIFFFLNREFSPILSQLKEFTWRRPRLPLVFLIDALVYTLAIYICFPDLGEGGGELSRVRSCFQWQISAITITLAWLNLLMYMRLIYGVGKYVILFQDVLITFLAISSVFIILLTAFGLGFYTLLSNQTKFSHPGHSMLKTMMMMSGETEYGEIFFKKSPTKGPSFESYIPFPLLTYSMFVIFFLLVSILGINVLVGLTVDDIRNFLQNADLRKLSMRLKFILESERHYLMKKKISMTIDPVFTKQSQYELPITNDLISKAKIWEKMENKREESRKRAEVELDRKNLTDMIDGQTKKLRKLMSKRWKAVTKVLKDSEKEGLKRRALQKYKGAKCRSPWACWCLFHFSFNYSFMVQMVQKLKISTNGAMTQFHYILLL